MHCAREDFSWESIFYEVRNERILCDAFVFLLYLTDVHPGYGGFVVLPELHKTSVERPPYRYDDSMLWDVERLPPEIVNITPKAGDFVISSKLLTHGALQWNPKDRYRCVLVLPC